MTARRTWSLALALLVTATTSAAGADGYPPDSRPLSEGEAAERTAPASDGVRPLLPDQKYLTAEDRRFLAEESARVHSQDQVLDALAKRKGWRSLRYRMTTRRRAIGPGETLLVDLQVLDARRAGAVVVARDAYVNEDAGAAPPVRRAGAKRKPVPGVAGRFRLSWRAPAKQSKYSGDLFLV